ncbi:MAG: SMP-30/gluconolactonase/LRE family protein [Thermoguttaceae bacterium]
MKRFTFVLALTLFGVGLTFAESVRRDGAEVVAVADGFTFTEGPAVNARGDIYFVDDPQRKIYHWNVGDKKLTTFVEDSFHANGLYVDKDGNVIACEGGNGCVVSYTPDGKKSVIAGEFDGKRFNKPNDLWIDPRGGIYFTDPVYGREYKVVQGGEHVYYISPDRKSVKRVADDYVRPNGIVGTPDGKTLYITDEAARKVWRYDINDDATLTGKQFFAEPAIDGMTLDERGNVYITTDKVLVFDPTGKLIETIECPEVPANVCFGGPDRKTLFITARTHLYSLEMKVAGAKPSVASGDNWPQFGGPNRDNIADETNLLRVWNTPPRLLWTAENIGKTPKVSGYGSPAVVAGKIYIAGNVAEDESSARDVLYCLDLSTGKEIWQCDIAAGWNVTRKYEGERSTPTIDGDRAYVTTGYGVLVCVDLTKRAVLWRQDFGKDFNAAAPFWGMAESPVVDGEIVFACPGGAESAVVAYNKITGELVWKSPAISGPGDGNSDSGNTAVESSSYATGTVFTWRDRRFFATMTERHLILVNVRDGKIVATHTHRNDREVKANTPRYLGDGLVVIASGYGDGGTELLQLNDDAGAVKITSLWRQTKLDNNHGSIVAVDGHVYGSSHRYKGGTWVCLDIKTGDVKWEDRGIGLGTVIAADGMLYAMDETEGKVALIEATPTAYHECGRFTLPEGGQGKYWAHLVIASGKLLVRHDHFLYCYEIAR